MSITPVASLNNSSFQNTTYKAKLDSGATKHFFKKEHLQFLHNIKSLTDGPVAHLPNGITVKTTHEGTVNFASPMLQKSSKVLVFPNLINKSLVSIGQLFDDGCIMFFTKQNAYITKNGKLLITGQRNTFDGLWDISLQSNATQQPMFLEQYTMNYIIKKKKTKHELASYYHVSLFPPTISTLMLAIKKGDLITWQGIDQLAFGKLLETTMATELGHLNQERKNLCSAKFTSISQNDYFPSKATIKTNDFFTQYFAMDMDQETNEIARRIYSDQTG